MSSGPLRVFISYSRRDRAFVDTLQEDLASLGYGALVDTKDIVAGEDWRARIEGIIREAHAVLFVISPDSIARWNNTKEPLSVCAWELRRSVALGKVVVPIFWRGHGKVALPAELSAVNYVLVGKGNGKLREWTQTRQAALPLIQQALNLPNEQWTREHTVWTARAASWEEFGRDDGRLLRSRDISDIQQWIARRPDISSPVPDIVHAFVDASLAKEKRDRDELELRERGVSQRTQRLFGALARKASSEGRHERAIRLSIAGYPTAPDRARGFPVEPFLETQLRQAAQRSTLCAALPASPDTVASLAFSDDERCLVVAYNSGTVSVMRTTDGEKVLTVDSHPPPNSRLNGAGFSPSGEHLHLFFSDGRCEIRGATDGAVEKTIHHPGSIAAAGYTPGAREFFTAGDRGLRFWNLETRSVRHVLDENSTITGLRFSENHVIHFNYSSARVCRRDEHHHFVSVGADSAAGGHEDAVLSVAITETGHLFAVGCADDFAYVHDLGTGASKYRLAMMKGRQNAEVRSVDFLLDGRYLLVACTDGFTRVIDCDDARVTYEHEFAHAVLHARAFASQRTQDLGAVALTSDGGIHFFRLNNAGRALDLVTVPTFDTGFKKSAFSSSGQLVAIASKKNQIGVWKAPPRRVWDAAHIRSHAPEFRSGENGTLPTDAIHLERRVHEVLEREDWRGRVEEDPDAGQQFLRASDYRFAGRAAQHGTICTVSNDETLAITVRNRTTMVVLDLTTLEPRYVRPFIKELMYIRLSPNNSFILTEDGSEAVSLLAFDTGIPLWSRRLDREPRQLNMQNRYEFSSDEALFLIIVDYVVEIRSTIDGRLICAFDEVRGSIHTSWFIPGTHLVVTTDFKGNIFIWDGDSANLLDTMSAARAVPLALSADRASLFAASEGGLIGWTSRWLYRLGPLQIAKDGHEHLRGLTDETGFERLEIEIVGPDAGTFDGKQVSSNELEAERERIRVMPYLPHYQSH